MNAELEQAIIEAYACAPQDVIILHTLEINHKAFAHPARVARWGTPGPDVERFMCKLENTAPHNPDEIVEFIGMPFEILLPEKSDSTPGELSLRVSGIGYELDADLEAASLSGGQISCIYRTYIHGEELKGPGEVWPGLAIKSPQSEGPDSMTAVGNILGWLNRKFGRKYTPNDYPALVNQS